jgi:hypothetical protein
MFENLDFMKIGGPTIISSPYFVSDVLKRHVGLKYLKISETGANYKDANTIVT